MLDATIALRDSIVTIMVHTDVVLYGELRASMSSAPKGPVSKGLVNSAKIRKTKRCLVPCSQKPRIQLRGQRCATPAPSAHSYALRSIPPSEDAHLSLGIAEARGRGSRQRTQHHTATLSFSIVPLTAIRLASGQRMTHRVPERPPRQPACSVSMACHVGWLSHAQP